MYGYVRISYILVAPKSVKSAMSDSNTVLKTKDTRIELRVTQEQKELLEKAAQLRGISVTAYTLSQVLPVARQDVETSDRLVLSNRDRDRFMAALENPPTLKGKLKDAILKYKDEYAI